MIKKVWNNTVNIAPITITLDQQYDEATFSNEGMENITVVVNGQTKVITRGNSWTSPSLSSFTASSVKNSQELSVIYSKTPVEDFTEVNNQFSSVNEQLAETAKVVNAEKFSALQDAITELNVGTKKILHVPDGTYSISSALTVSSDNTEINISPNAKIVSTVSNINTFIITGKNCSLNGGTIEYPSTFDGVNRKWEDYEAAVLVKGNGFKASNVTLKNIFKVGFGVRGASDCIFDGNKIEGNYPASGWTGIETSHYGISIDPFISGGGENILVTNNIIKSCVQGIFVGNYASGTGYGLNFSNNAFVGCHNHGIYSAGGIGTVINANSFNRCSLPIAITGKYAVITNNSLYTHSTGNNLDDVGISVREATHCNISNNVIKGDALINSVIIDLSNLTDPNDTIDNNIVSGNIIEVTGNDHATAIRVGITTKTKKNFNNIIKDNIIKCKGAQYLGLIGVYTHAEGMGKGNQIIGNNIIVSNDCYAIYLTRQRGAILSGNIVTLEYNAPSPVTMTLIQQDYMEDSLVTQNNLRCESNFGTNITLRGLREGTGTTRNLVTGNLINLDPTLLVAKTEIYVNPTSKSLNNMVGGVYVS